MTSKDYFDYPFHIDERGRVANTDEDDHIRDLIEQVLFTSPGERVNLPDFGCGIKQLVFAPNSQPLATITQFTINQALQKWLGTMITVQSVDVVANEATLNIQIVYVKRTTLEKKTVTLST
jgi:phage baseplate assembly protein W